MLPILAGICYINSTTSPSATSFLGSWMKQAVPMPPSKWTKKVRKPQPSPRPACLQHPPVPLPTRYSTPTIRFSI